MMRTISLLLLAVLIVGCVHPPTPIDPRPVDPSPKPVDPQPPAPQPTPKPVDPPAPVDPRPAAGEFGVAPTLYDIACRATSKSRAEDCRYLADECKRISQFSSVDGSSLQHMADMTVKALKALPSGWDELKASVSNAVIRLRGAGSLNTRQDMARLLIECSGAFDAAAKARP